MLFAGAISSPLLLLLLLPAAVVAQPRQASKTWDGMRVEPAPLAEVLGEETATENSETSDILRRIERAGPDGIVVLRGVVAGLTVLRDLVPREVWPDGGVQVVTDMRLRVADVICGAARGETVVARYIGGTFREGASFHNSQMPSDPPIGGEYVFVLQVIDGRNYLSQGRYNMLIVIDNTTYSDGAGKMISQQTLTDSCP